MPEIKGVNKLSKRDPHIHGRQQASTDTTRLKKDIDKSYETMNRHMSGTKEDRKVYLKHNDLATAREDTLSKARAGKIPAHSGNKK